MYLNCKVLGHLLVGLLVRRSLTPLTPFEAPRKERDLQSYQTNCRTWSQDADADFEVPFATCRWIVGVAKQQPFIQDGVRRLRIHQADVADERPDLRVRPEGFGVVDADVDEVFEEMIGHFVEVEEEGLVEGRSVGRLDDFGLLGLIGDGDLDSRRDVAAGQLTTLHQFDADLKVYGFVSC